MNYVMVFFLFTYYGCLCFGGGSALTPIYIEDLVHQRQWMTLEEFGNLIAISQMTPGPIGVNAATFFGTKYAGIPGGALATIGLLLVPFFLMIGVVKSLQRWSETIVVKGIMEGIRPAVFALIGASLLIFMGLSVFTAQIPWGELFTLQPLPAKFGLSIPALIIFLISAIVLLKTKVPIITVIFLAALFGSFFC